LEFTGLFFGTSTILVALLGAFAYGCGDFMGGRAAVRLSPSGAVALAQCAAVAVTVQAFLNGGGGLPSAHVIGPGLLGGSAYLIGLTALYQGIAFGRIGIVAPVSGLVGIVVPLVGDLVLGRHIGGAQFTGILICCLAFVLLSATRDTPVPGVAPHFSLRLGILSGLGFGTADLCVGVMAPEDGPAAVMVARIAAALIALNLLGVAVVRSGALRLYHAALAGPPIAPQVAGLRPTGLRAMLPAATLAIIAAAFDSVGHMSYAHIATGGSMAVASALVALYPVVPVVLAVVLLNERMIRTQYIGLAASAVGVAVMSQ
jgi:drug/metabolite transporter (DMT)-like permease